MSMECKELLPNPSEKEVREECPYLVVCDALLMVDASILEDCNYF